MGDTKAMDSKAETLIVNKNNIFFKCNVEVNFFIGGNYSTAIEAFRNPVDHDKGK